MGHISRSTEDSGAESNVNNDGWVKGFQRKIILVSVL